MSDVTVEHDVSIKCECGRSLSATAHLGEIEVEPCDDCKEEAYNDGKAYGYSEAEKELS